MSLIGIRQRTKVVQKLREILLSRGFEEFIPQLLEKNQPLEPTLHAFSTNDFFLATSPESYLKRAMAAGSNNCFAISHAFRNQEQANYLHNPDFLMLESYLKDSDYQGAMKLCQELVSEILNLPGPWPQISWKELWKKYLHDEPILEFAKKRGYNLDNATWEQVFYQVYYNEIEPHLGKEPFFLIDFPIRISPLAKPKDAEFAERFELIYNKIELADGNTELFDAESVQKVMAEEFAKRQEQKILTQPVDETFLAALKALEGQKWAGFGLGVDRLAMFAGKISSINEIISP